MAHSLSEECTPLKREYDSCFNAWFEGYLQPVVAASSSPEERAEHAQAKQKEYEEKCGKVWEAYRSCVRKAVKEKGLDEMLAEATKENPLDKPDTENSS